MIAASSRSSIAIEKSGIGGITSDFCVTTMPTSKLPAENAFFFYTKNLLKNLPKKTLA
jgi:hypothetical protein